LRRAFRKELRRFLKRAAPDAGRGAIHAIRKGLTRLRSWLRLVRGQINARQFQTHNRRLRKAARALAPLRDARVRLEAFEGIATASAFPNTSRYLCRQARRAKRAVPDVMPQVKRRLKKEFAASNRLPWAKITATDLAVAVERMRAEVEATFAAARDSDRMELRHTWRKRTKNLQHALGFLTGEDGRQYRAIARINRLLGADHDLAVLEAELVRCRAPAECRSLQASIAARRLRLQAQFFAKSGPRPR